MAALRGYTEVVTWAYPVERLEREVLVDLERDGKMENTVDVFVLLPTAVEDRLESVATIPSTLLQVAQVAGPHRVVIKGMCDTVSRMLE